MCAFTGMKFSVMKRATRSSGYTSASSRAHPLQRGAALKSNRIGLPAALDWASASSTFFSQEIVAIMKPSHVE
jgi:hypothetical protein